MLVPHDGIGGAPTSPRLVKLSEGKILMYCLDSSVLPARTGRSIRRW